MYIFNKFGRCFNRDVNFLASERKQNNNKFIQSTQPNCFVSMTSFMFSIVDIIISRVQYCVHVY